MTTTGICWGILSGNRKSLFLFTPADCPSHTKPPSPTGDWAISRILAAAPAATAMEAVEGIVKAVSGVEWRKRWNYSES